MSISNRKILIFLIVFCSLIPNIGFKFSTFGFNWTFYRLAVLISIIMYFWIPRKTEKLIAERVDKQWITFMTVWVTYGSVLMIVSPYRDLHNGIIEILSIFNGLVCIIILTSIIRNINDFNQIISIIYVTYLGLVIYGCFECITGFHLPVSYFHDETVTHLVGRRAATGMFYSENDFSAFLTCLLPMMFYRKNKQLTGIIALVGVIYIDYVNDANICLLSMIIGIAYYYIFVKRYGKNRIIVRTVLILLTVVSLAYVWNNLRHLAKSSTLLNVIYSQYTNVGLSQGSMYSRIVIYLDSLKASFNTSFLGIGPDSFSNYFHAHPSKSGLINPHNLYLEILVEYGLVITVAFVTLLVKMIHTIRKKALSEKDKSMRRLYVAGCEMLILYSMVCIASSSFIGYSWQWIVITIGLVFSGASEEKLALLNSPNAIRSPYSSMPPMGDNRMYLHNEKRKE